MKDKREIRELAGWGRCTWNSEGRIERKLEYQTKFNLLFICIIGIGLIFTSCDELEWKDEY